MLKLLFHLDLQQLVQNYYCSKRRMKIHTEQNKPHRKWMSIAHIIIVSLTLIKSGVTIVYIRKIIQIIRDDLKYPHWM